MKTFLFRSKQKEYIPQAMDILMQLPISHEWLKGQSWQSQAGSQFMSEALLPLLHKDNCSQISTFYGTDPSTPQELIPLHTFISIYISSFRYCIDPINSLITLEKLEKRILKARPEIKRVIVGAYYPLTLMQFGIEIDTLSVPLASEYLSRIFQGEKID